MVVDVHSHAWQYPDHFNELIGNMIPHAGPWVVRGGAGGKGLTLRISTKSWYLIIAHQDTRCYFLSTKSFISLPALSLNYKCLTIN